MGFLEEGILQRYRRKNRRRKENTWAAANAKKYRHYDQIAFRTREDSLSIVKDDAGNESAGVFDYYDVVFRHPTRQECLHATHGLFWQEKKWRTQISEQQEILLTVQLEDTSNVRPPTNVGRTQDRSLWRVYAKQTRQGKKHLISTSI